VMGSVGDWVVPLDWDLPGARPPQAAPPLPQPCRRQPAESAAAAQEDPLVRSRATREAILEAVAPTYGARRLRRQGPVGASAYSRGGAFVLSSRDIYGLAARREVRRRTRAAAHRPRRRAASSARVPSAALGVTASLARLDAQIEGIGAKRGGRADEAGAGTRPRHSMEERELRWLSRRARALQQARPETTARLREVVAWWQGAGRRRLSAGWEGWRWRAVAGRGRRRAWAHFRRHALMRGWAAMRWAWRRARGARERLLMAALGCGGRCVLFGGPSG
jgi:hypothetical protein